MPTPKEWTDAAKRALERENARITPGYAVKRRDSAGNIAEVQLWCVSLVSEPLHPDWTIHRVTDPETEC